MNGITKLTGILPGLSGMLLRLEGFLVFAGGIILYIFQGASGWLFVLLFFVPDLSMVGYLFNTRTGSLTYNMVHNYVLPGILMVIAYAIQWDLGIQIGLIWCAHIGMDRMLGYGLKYPTAFKDTHLQRV